MGRYFVAMNDLIGYKEAVQPLSLKVVKKLHKS